MFNSYINPQYQLNVLLIKCKIYLQNKNQMQEQGAYNTDYDSLK